MRAMRPYPAWSAPGAAAAARLTAWLACAFLLSILAEPLRAQTQLIRGASDTQAASEQADSWTPPDVANLPKDWWSKFRTDNPERQQERGARLLAAVEARISGLAGNDRVLAETALGNLRSLAGLLDFTRQTDVQGDFQPVPTRDVYTLDDLLEIRALRRDLDLEQKRVQLLIDQSKQQGQLLEARRERAVKRYEGLPVESPGRVVTGLNRVVLRVELELNRVRGQNLNQRLQLVQERIKLVSEQQKFARAHLDTGDMTLESVEESLQSARARVAEAGDRVTSLQAQLVEALSEDPPRPSLELLRRQQLTRDSADLELAEMQLELAEVRANWYRLRAGGLDLGFDFSTAAADARRLVEQARGQVALWSDVTQATLISDPPADSRNARANHELALEVARETLDLIEDVRATGDELLLVHEIFATELVEAQSGLRKAWSSLQLSAASFWDRLEAIADYDLFHIGDTEVTPAGIVTMILIIVLAWLVSRLTRYLITRASTGSEHFIESSVAYTLGRILHYVIMTVGVFAAFTSIGFDFTSFALIAGALSVGIGFGLQAVVNNFVSGLILLLEGSLRVGDYIELETGLAGVVREINTRATVVNTNDNVDVVVPNSELVTTRLTNWTLRESIARMRIPFGVAYGSDKEKVKEVAMAAAGDVEYVLNNVPGRRPQLRLYNFGDSALEFQMLLWVSRAGVRRPHRIRCHFLWALETRLVEAGIEIPFPQRDLHLRSGFEDGDLVPAAGKLTDQPPEPMLETPEKAARSEAGEAAESP
jgi:small-conductance mechanosensitive channel